MTSAAAVRERPYPRILFTAGGGLFACVATLLASAALKSYCLGDWQAGSQPKSCYNDIQSLWYARDLGSHALPYSGAAVERLVRGELVELELVRGQLEYPVLTGIFAWLTALPAGSAAGYLMINALVLALLAVLTWLLLHRLAGPAALIFAATPPLAAYAFLNWDLLPVLATVAAIYAWQRDRPAAAAALLAVGACAKVYPGFLLVPLLVHALITHGRRVAATMAGVATAVVVALNLPFLLASPSGWAAPYRFQALRANDETTNSVWFVWARGWPLERVGLVSTLAVLACWAVLAGFAVRRARAGHPLPWLQVGAAMVAGYMLLGRVDSPQFALWLLPFLVLLAVPVPVALGYLGSNLLLWLSWSWLYSQLDDVRLWVQILHAAALAVLAVAFLLAEPRSVARPQPGSDQGGERLADPLRRDRVGGA